MKVAILTTELAPLAKTGGLADVSASLSQHLTAMGHEVTLMLPYYPDIRVRPTRILSPLRFQFGGRQVTYSIIESEYKGVHLVLIDAPQYFHREGIYGDDRGEYRDNDERFILFTRACLDYYVRKDTKPDVFHANDWPTALTGLYLKTHYVHEPLGETPVLFTIHNAAYQGIFPRDRYHLLDLGWEYFTSEGIEFFESINFLKAGVVFSDVLTTVSPKYSEEIQTPEYGFRLDGLFRSRREHLHGILNGIDEDAWNPATDTNIAANYSVEDVTGKAECRRALLGELGWDPESALPVVSMITRLATQKGVDLLLAAADRLLKMEMRLVILGDGDTKYEEFLGELSQQNPDRVKAILRFDSKLAHRIEAGADMFLMPSRYEPCGLNQMYSLRYGTVPIVRATGGLDDSVREWDAQTRAGNGFKFTEYKADDMLESVHRALVVFQNRDSWMQLMRNGMSESFSWNTATQQYADLYRLAGGLKS